MTPNGLPPGTLLGAFEIVSTLGRGGMGAVYAAKNRITGDMRAVKIILPELVARPEFSERFVREIRMAMAVEHPNLVRVFEPGMHGELIFLPMELLQGESLSVFLRRQRLVSIEATNNLVQAIGSAIVALHARGILHRDVKPSNIFLAHDRGMVVPKLLDLGAGKDVEGTEENTSTGLAIGSPHYMAPEQAAGRKDLDGRVDQYALATVAYQLLTGARPYENDDTGHVLAKVLSGAPFRSPKQLLASIPSGLDQVILRAMARNRDERFPTVPDFLMAMHAASTEAAGRPPPYYAPAMPPQVPGGPPAIRPLPSRNLPTVRAQLPSTESAATAPSQRPGGPDPSGTVQTGVTGRPGPSLGLVGAISGLSTLALLAVLAWVFAPRTPPVAVAPPAPARAAAAAPVAHAAAPPTVPSGAVASAPPPPSASAAPPPAPSASVAAASPPDMELDAPPGRASAAPTAAPAPPPPPFVTAATPATPATPPPPPVHAAPPAPPPAPVAVVAPPTPLPVTAAAVAAPAPRPKPKPAAPAAGAAEPPCRPTPGSPCL